MKITAIEIAHHRHAGAARKRSARAGPGAAPSPLRRLLFDALRATVRRCARVQAAAHGALRRGLHGCVRKASADARSRRRRSDCVQEMVHAFYFGWYDRFVTKLPPLLKGEITIPDGAGLGLQLQPDVAKRPGASVRRTTAMDL